MRKLVIGLLIIVAVSLLFTGCGGGGGGGGGPTTGAVVHFKCVDQYGDPAGAGYTLYFTDPSGHGRSAKISGSSNLTIICDVPGTYTFTQGSFNGQTVELLDPKPTFSVTSADVTNRTEFWYTLVGHSDVPRLEIQPAR